jgi:hypothetical protein
MFPTEPIRRHCDVASPRPPKQGSNLRDGGSGSFGLEFRRLSTEVAIVAV